MARSCRAMRRCTAGNGRWRHCRPVSPCSSPRARARKSSFERPPRPRRARGGARADPRPHGLKYLLVPVGRAGDVNPIPWLARLMARRGHDVVVVAHAGMAQVPSRAGLRTLAVGKAADHDALVANPDLWHPDRAFNLLA